MASPIVTIQSVTAYRISAISGHNTTMVSFLFDQPITAYSVNVLGTAPTTGTICDSQKWDVASLKNNTVQQASQKTVADTRSLASGAVITTTLNNAEMYAEGDNRVNVYGQALDGTWTPYGG